MSKKIKKQKFSYKHETLSYVKVEVTWKERLLKDTLVSARAIVLGFLLQVIYSAIFLSPYEKGLERENEFANEQLDITQEQVTLLTAVLEDIEKIDNEFDRVT